jgi:hypothetical protein
MSDMLQLVVRLHSLNFFQRLVPLFAPFVSVSLNLAHVDDKLKHIGHLLEWWD